MPEWLEEGSAMAAGFAIFGLVMGGIIYSLLWVKKKRNLKLSQGWIGFLALLILGVLFYIFATIAVWIAE